MTTLDPKRHAWMTAPETRAVLDALMRATRPEKSIGPSVWTFPELPDRWLITRVARIAGQADVIRSWVVDSAYVNAASSGEIFNIGSDIEITTGQGIALVEEILGKKARLKKTPARAGDQLRTHADITKARAVLGYAPRVAPREGLAAQVEWAARRFSESR